MGPGAAHRTREVERRAVVAGLVRDLGERDRRPRPAVASRRQAPSSRREPRAGAFQVTTPACESAREQRRTARPHAVGVLGEEPGEKLARVLAAARGDGRSRTEVERVVGQRCIAARGVGEEMRRPGAVSGRERHEA